MNTQYKSRAGLLADIMSLAHGLEDGCSGEQSVCWHKRMRETWEAFHAPAGDPRRTIQYRESFGAMNEGFPHDPVFEIGSAGEPFINYRSSVEILRGNHTAIYAELEANDFVRASRSVRLGVEMRTGRWINEADNTQVIVRTLADGEAVAEISNNRW